MTMNRAELRRDALSFGRTAVQGRAVVASSAVAALRRPWAAGWSKRVGAGCLSVALALLPMNQAQAFTVTPNTLQALSFRTTPNPAGALLSLFGVSVLVGASVMGLVLEDSAGNKIDLPVKNGGESTAPSAPATSTPTASGSGYQCSGGSYAVGYGSTIAAACSQPRAYLGQYPCPSYDPGSGVCYGNVTGYRHDSGFDRHYLQYTRTTYCVNGPCSGGIQTGEVFSSGMAEVQVTPQGGVTVPTSCPAGYVVSGTSCVLQEARQATPDNRCDLKFSGTGSGSKYLFYSDADCPGGATVDNSQFVPGLRTDGQTAFVYTKDSSGRPVLVEVVAAPDGSSVVVRHYTQDTSGGNSIVQKTELQVDRSTGTVTNAASSTQVGSISTPSSSTVPTTTTTAPSTSDTPTVSTSGQTYQKPETAITVNTCGIPGQPACVVDDSAFNQTAPGITVPSSDLNAEKNALDNMTAPDVGWSWLPSLMPGNVVACEPLAFRFQTGAAGGNLDATTELDLCPYLDIGRWFFGFLFHVGAIVYVWRRFVNSNQGAA